MRETEVSIMAKTTSKATAKPVKNSTKPAKGGHYTPPNSSKDLPPSFYNPLNGKGKKKGIPDD